MTKKEIQDYLGSDYVVKDIVEDKNELFAFYVSREFEESGGNDRYMLVGSGPFYFNKKTQEKRRLGVVEFHDHFIEKKIFKENSVFDYTEPSLEEVIQKAKKRKYINFDEFEIIMNSLGIDLHRVSISSSDLIHETIESPNDDDITKFRKIFEEVELEFKQESPNKIILKNNPDSIE